MSETVVCGKCKEDLARDEKFIKCNLCDRSYHIICEDVSTAALNHLLKIRKDRRVLWLCTSCADTNPLDHLKLVPALIRAQEKLAAEVEALREEIHEKVAPGHNGPKADQEANEATEAPRAVPTNAQGIQPQAVHAPPSLDCLVAELEERKRRECNAVFVGLDSPTTEKDKEHVIEFCKRELNVDVSATLERVWRPRKPAAAGKRPLLFAKFVARDARDNILSAARRRPRVDDPQRLVYINPDLTAEQRARLALLRDEVRVRRSRGEQVRLSGVRIVPVKN